jgi:ketosteroid isomerase-like protein
MSTDDNKRIVLEFCSRFTRGDVPGLMSLMTEDATWRVPGKPGTTPVVGVRSRTQIERMFQFMMNALTDGLQMTIKTLTAEDDRVAAEAESHGVLKNGRVYENVYHLLFTLRDGKIREVHEYYDTQHALDVWFGP